MKKLVLLILITIAPCIYSAADQPQAPLTEEQVQYVHCFLNNSATTEEQLLQLKNNPGQVFLALESLQEGNEMYEILYQNTLSSLQQVWRAKSIEEVAKQCRGNMVRELAPILKASMESQMQQLCVLEKNLTKKDRDQVKSIVEDQLLQQVKANMKANKQLIETQSSSPSLNTIKSTLFYLRKAFKIKQDGPEIQEVSESQFSELFKREISFRREMIKNFISGEGQIVVAQPPSQKELNSPEIINMAKIAFDNADQIDFSTIFN